MLIGRVLKTIVAPTKHDGLVGTKLLLVDIEDGGQVLAVDCVGAGIGSRVIVAQGSHPARIAAPQAPADAVIVGLIDV